jgi:hypothetical protein
MISATGMMRSQRWDFTEFKLGALLTEEHGVIQWLTFLRKAGKEAITKLRVRRPSRIVRLNRPPA